MNQNGISIGAGMWYEIFGTVTAVRATEIAQEKLKQRTAGKTAQLIHQKWCTKERL
jgi:hypothetical protein